MNIICFETYSKDALVLKDGQRQKYSLKDLLSMENEEIKAFVFQYELIGQPVEENPRRAPLKRYFSIKLNKLELFGDSFKVINLQDQTVNILFNISQGEKKILQLVNACVSHEMRNPINSILATNLKLRASSSELRDLMRQIQQNEGSAEAEAKIDALTKEIEELSETQESSSKLLNPYVADLLCLA